jgi:hypothetical protein
MGTVKVIILSVVCEAKPYGFELSLSRFVGYTRVFRHELPFGTVLGRKIVRHVAVNVLISRHSSG